MEKKYYGVAGIVSGKDGTKVVIHGTIPIVLGMCMNTALILKEKSNTSDERKLYEDVENTMIALITGAKVNKMSREELLDTEVVIEDELLELIERSKNGDVPEDTAFAIVTVGDDEYVSGVGNSKYLFGELLRIQMEQIENTLGKYTYNSDVAIIHEVLVILLNEMKNRGYANLVDDKYDISEVV